MLAMMEMYAAKNELVHIVIFCTPYALRTLSVPMHKIHLYRVFHRQSTEIQITF